MTKSIIIDTSAYSEFNRGNIKLKKYINSENNLILPIIVLGELRAGFLNGNNSLKNEQLLQKFANSINVDTLILSEETTKIYAKIYKKLRSIGKPINTNDMWIAALAIEHKFSLLSLDSDFRNIAGLELIKI